MRHPDYVNMSLLDALHLSKRLSGKSEDEIGAAMSWSPGNTARIFGTGDYWPTLPNIPKLCVVMGNNVLIDWQHAQAHAGGVRHDFPSFDCAELLRGMNQLMCDLGDAAKECERAVAHSAIQPQEATRLIKRLLGLATDTVHTIRGLRPIAGCTCRETEL